MDVRVLRVDEKAVELGCKLSPNHNHLGSAFGGSLTALMILAAYCRLFYLMNGKGHVLLKSCKFEFIQPVREDLRAVCLPPSQLESSRFLEVYGKKSRARLHLSSEVLLADGRIAARMQGEFVGRSE